MQFFQGYSDGLSVKGGGGKKVTHFRKVVFDIFPYL